MKKIFTLFTFVILTASLGAQVIWEGSFEQSEGWAGVGTSVSGQKNFFSNGLILDQSLEGGFWDLLFSTGTVKDYTTEITADANTGSQALLITLTTTSGECKLRSYAQNDLTEGDPFNITYYAKTDEAGVALGGALIGGIKDDWKTLTTEYQKFTDVANLQGTLKFFIYFPDATNAGFKVYIDDVKIEKASTTPVSDLAVERNFNVFPNPVSDFLYFQNVSKVDAATVYSLAGKKILEFKDATSGIDLSTLSKGMYILSAEIDGVPVTRKFTRK